MSDTAPSTALPGRPDTHRCVTIANQRGLHARAAAKFVKLASSFDAEVLVTKGSNAVSGSSIMGLMMLAAAPGCRIRVAASGPDAKAAVEALAELVERKFDED
ncbi:HPr family phosphocarrier protein [Algihabitans albus]|uniref:HPr family phosphocarrier protein n=1 Tax=Algihabitans albus TaxID=2164067 RepID=UPI000E5CEBA9|nr:HPr family phosphocarrier protein [Algihabitans albus]